MSSIGSRIHDRRVELGLSVDKLAEMLGKNRATIYRYESSEIENLRISVIGPLASALQTTPAYLMGWSTEKNPTPGTEDGKYSEFLRLFSQLSESERTIVIDLIKSILKARE